MRWATLGVTLCCERCELPVPSNDRRNPLLHLSSGNNFPLQTPLNLSSQSSRRILPTDLLIQKRQSRFHDVVYARVSPVPTSERANASRSPDNSTDNLTVTATSIRMPVQSN